MAKALNKTGRPIVFGTEWAGKLLENPPLVNFCLKKVNEEFQVNYTLLVENCNLNRVFVDIKTSWDSILGIVDIFVLMQDQLISISGPGYWNDPDTVSLFYKTPKNKAYPWG